MHPSTRTPEGGLSNGVALVSQCSNRLSDIPLDSIVVLPPLARCIIKLWHGLVDMGAPRLNLCLHTGEGSADRNAQLLMQVAYVVRTIGAPHLISAGWNMTPEGLEATGVLELAGGIVIVPGGNTYESGGGFSKIDYCVVHHAFHAATCEVLCSPLAP
eukprot:9496075-Pyramimonas_sp.AAC.1